MKNLLTFTLVSVFSLAHNLFGDANASAPSDKPALPSDFFADALSQAKAGDDAMGTQRLVDVKSSELTPALSLSSSYKYSSNPTKSTIADKLEDGTTFDLSLMMMMGLGEYGIGDDVLSTPSLMLMHMRTYNDPVQDFGHDLRALDMDIQIAGNLRFPLFSPMIIRFPSETLTLGRLTSGTTATLRLIISRAMS